MKWSFPPATFPKCNWVTAVKVIVQHGSRDELSIVSGFIKIASMSLSSEIRNQGNEFFRRACRLNPSSSPQEAKDLYEKALSCYYQAKDKSDNRDDECSAAKNIGKAAWRIAGFLSKKAEKPQTIIFYLHEAIKGLCTAYNHSETCKDVEWRAEVFETLTVCLQEVMNASEALEDADQKIAQLEKLCSLNTVVEAAPDIQLALAVLYFHDGTTKLQNGDYKKCLTRMKDCYRPIEEVKRLGRYAEVTRATREILTEVRVLEQDVFYNTCSASSIQARVQGDQLLHVALQEQEDLDMTLIFEVIDWYKQAVVLAREVDIEQEAITESRLGVVYDKVLKLTLRAKQYFTHSFELAESLKPRIFTSLEWYKDCTAALKRYQDEARRRDEQERQKVRASFLEALSEELDDLRAHKLEAIPLIKHLYTKYPPKITTWKKPSDEEIKKWGSVESESKDYKKILLKALSVYHPDKVDENLYGMKWKVLCEEITKMLNFHYERTKNISD